MNAELRRGGVRAGPRTLESPAGSRRPILITGAHRSGTTWVGQIMAAAPGTHHIHEPFSVSDPPGPGVCSIAFQQWFTNICSTNEARYLKPLQRMLALEYHLPAALGSVIARHGKLNRIAAEALALRRARHDGARPLVKDPLAFFSAPWLASRFGAQIVVLIRHPAAFASSIQQLGWRHPFGHFLAQPLLLREVLSPFENEIRRYAHQPPEILDEAILLWRMIYHTVIQYEERHPDWIFRRHEDLSRDPATEFQALFARLGLVMSESAENRLRDYTDASNPTDPAIRIGSHAALRRNSAQNIHNWRRRLTTVQIRHVRDGTMDIAQHFYSDDDW